MEDATATLKAHFGPRRNTVAECHAFRKRVQAPRETMRQYIVALWDLAATCDFAATLDDMLRNQLVVSSHRIHERLVLESELTLEKAITIATQTEAAGEQAKLLSSRGVTRHLSHKTRQDTRLGSREQDETRFLDFLFFLRSSMMKYIGKTLLIQLKNTKC